MATILVVDDRPVNRELLVTLLGYSGHRLLEAADGIAALALARAERPDLIIADIVMPTMDGYELARQVRADPFITATQIVFYTSSYVVAETRQLAEACGVSYIITKPAEPEIILEIVNAALNSSQLPAAAPVPDEFHREHMRLLTDTLARKVEELEAEVVQHRLADERLRQSEIRFRALIENAPDAIVLLDLDGRITYLSPTTQRILGYTTEEAIGLDPEALTHPEDLSALLSLLDALEPMPGHSEAVQFRLRHKDGSWRWVEGTFTNLLTEPGVNANVFNFRDITDRKQAQTQLEFQAHVLENINDAVVATDEQFRVVAWNRMAEVLYGWSVAEAVGRSVDELLRTEFTPEQLTTAIRQVQQEGFFRSEVVQHKKDGSALYIEGNTISLTDDQGQITGYVSVNRDIGERRQGEKLLADTLAFNQTIIETSPTGIITYRASGQAVSANEAVAHLIGATVDQVRSQNFRELESWRASGLLALAERALASNTVQEADVHFTSSFGREVWLSARLAPFHFRDELHLLGLFTDVAERKRADLQIHRQLDRLAALRSIDTAITSSFDLRITLRVLLDEVMTQLGAHAAAILQHRSYLNRLEYIVGRGFQGKSIERLTVRLGEPLAGRVALGRQMLKIVHLPTSDFTSPELKHLEAEGFVSYYGLPLVAKGNVKGVLEIFCRVEFVADQDWLNFVEALAGQAAIAIDNAELFDGLQRTNLDLALAYDATIEGWSKALDLRDKETEGHTQRVTEMTLRLARQMRFPEEDIVHLRRGALLHDIGKMGVPDAILLKPDKLTDEEWIVMRLHPVYAYEMLSPINYLRPALDIPYCHHEKWDGTGYPRGLKGDEIPLAARIFAVIDVWDALRSARPYRAAWPEARVRQHIRDSVGTHFDPQVAEAFLKN